MGNDSYLEEPGQSSGAAGQALAQQDNPDPDNDADNDADLSVDAEPAMEQQVSIQNLFKYLASSKNWTRVPNHWDASRWWDLKVLAEPQKI